MGDWLLREATTSTDSVNFKKKRLNYIRYINKTGLLFHLLNGDYNPFFPAFVAIWEDHDPVCRKIMACDFAFCEKRCHVARGMT